MIFMIMGVPSEGLNCFLNSGSNSAMKKKQEVGSVTWVTIVVGSNWLKQYIV
jgi:hypothetical protein